MELSKESLIDSFCIGIDEPLESISALNLLKVEYPLIVMESLPVMELLNTDTIIS
jgi:hypothetical protein